MKKYLLLFFLAILVAIPAKSQEFIFGNLYYTVIDSDQKTVRVSGYTNDLTGDLNIPSTVDYEDITYSVVEIEQEALRYSPVTTVTIPETVTSIGINAFEHSSLTSVTIPDGVTSIGYYAFFQCKSLESVKLPNRLTTIPSSTFYSCESLKSVTLPDELTTIEDYAFAYCYKLDLKTLPNTVTSIGEGAFAQCHSLTSMTIPDNVTVIENYTFRGCSAMTEVKLPDALTSIGIYALAECPTLTKIKIPDGVTSIGDNAFVSSGLTEMKLPDALTSIGTSVFSGCDKLKSINIPAAVTSIKERTFSNCTSLSLTLEDSEQPLTIVEDAFGENNSYGRKAKISSLYIGRPYEYHSEYPINSNLLARITPGTITIGTIFTNTNGIPDIADISIEKLIIPDSDTPLTFDSAIKARSVYMGRHWSCAQNSASAFSNNLSEITFGPNVTEFPDYTFIDCSKLKSINIPDAVTTIPGFAFSGCSALTEIKIPDNVTSISNSAFSGCSALTEIKIPDNVTSISNSAFSNCRALTEITIPANVTSIGRSAFNNCALLTSVIIEDSDYGLEIDKEDNWGNVTTLYLGRFCTFTGNDYYSSQFLKELKSLTISPNVPEIPESAFSGCSFLASLTVADSENMLTFGNNTISDGITNLYMGRNWSGATFGKLTELTIGPKVTEIPDNAFKGSSNLASVTLPDALTSIGSNAFNYCSALTAINIPGAVTYIGNNAFYNCSNLTLVNIPDNATLTTIGDYAFNNCSALTAINIPDAVTYIGNNAFYNCSALPVVNIPEGLTEISASAFENSGLKTINFPDAVSTIGDKAFRGSKLTTVSIPATVTSIAREAFFCDNLTSVTIEDSDNTLSIATLIDGYHGYDNQRYAFGKNVTSLYIGRNYQYSDDSPFYGITTLTDVTVGPKVTEIPGFSGCSSLASLTVADSENTLTFGNYSGGIATLYMGRNWTGATFGKLTELTIGPKVTEIPDNAFKGSSNLASVTLPDELTAIGSNAFDGCSALTEIKIPATVNTIGSNAFHCANLASVTLEHGENTLFLGDTNHDGTNRVFGIKIGDLYLGRNWDCSSTSDSPFAGTSVENVTIDPVVSEIKESTFRDCKSLAAIIIPEGLSSIGPWAFNGCSKLQAITIPNTVTTIGERAFSGCSGLTQVSLPVDGALSNIESEVFNGCSALTAIKIPSSVNSIGSNAFNGCSSLTEITIPASVTSIGNNAFSYCSKLADLKIADSGNTLEFGSDALKYTAISALYLGRNWTGLTLNSLNGTLKTATIGNMMTEIQPQAFYGCSGLTEVNLPVDGALSNIGQNAFSGCSSLTSMTIPNSVNFIGDNSFNGCSALTEVNLPIDGALSNIGQSAFSGCSSLTSMTIPNSVNFIDSNAFNGCSSLTSVIIPPAVTTIGNNSFYGCSRLVKSAYPEHLGNPFTSGIAIPYPAGGSVFDDRGVIYDLEKVYFAPLSLDGAYKIPEGMTTIGDNAFYGCSALTQVSLPAGVTTIGDKAFAGCPKLATITSNPTTPPAAIESSFQGLYDTAMVELADDAIQNYLYADVWPNFKNIKGTALYSDNVFKYRLISDSRSAILIKNGNSYNSMTVASIPSRVVEETPSGDATFYNVTGIGPDAFNGCTKLTKITWPGKLEQIAENAFKGCTGLTEVTLPNSVLSLGVSAFENATRLKSISLSTSLTEIGDRAFFGCPALTEIALPNTVASLGASAFENATALKSVSLSESLTKVADRTFFGCPALTEIALPNSVTSIGNSVFENATALKSVSFSKSLEEIGDRAFFGCSTLPEITLPNTVTSFGNSAFEKTTALKSVTLSESLDEINDRAFFGCTSLTEVTIPNAVTSIEGSAFESATALKSVTLSKSLKYIDGRAFFGCIALTEMSIPNSVRTISRSVFSGCTNLTKITVEDGGNILSTGDAFKYGYLKTLYMGRDWEAGENASVFDSKLSELTIGPRVTTIPQYAFKGCTAIKSVTIPNNVAYIGTEAFSGTGIKNVIFGGTVETIKDYAFYGCSLESVVIPSSVKTVGTYAFASNPLQSVSIGCGMESIGEKTFDGANNLATINITAVNPPDAQNNTFSYYGGQLYVTPGSEDAYYNFPRCWYRFEGKPLTVAESLKGDQGNIVYRPGEKLQLSVKIYPENTSLKNIFWVSSNPDIAPVDNNGLVTFVKPDDSEIETYADEDVKCEIRAYTLYADVPAAVFEVKASQSDIDDIETSGDEVSDGPVEVYTLQGVKIADSTEGLNPGFYIIRQGGQTRKVLIK